MCRPIYLSKSRTEKLNCMPSWNYAHLYVLNVFCVICGLLAPLCYTLHVTLTVEKHAVMQFLCGHQPSQAALRWDDRWWGMAECSSGTRILVFMFLALAQRPKWSKGHGRFSIKIISAHEDQVPPNKAVAPKFYSKKNHLGNNVRGARVAGAGRSQSQSRSQQNGGNWMEAWPIDVTPCRPCLTHRSSDHRTSGALN